MVQVLGTISGVNIFANSINASNDITVGIDNTTFLNNHSISTASGVFSQHVLVASGSPGAPGLEFESEAGFGPNGVSHSVLGGAPGYALVVDETEAIQFSTITGVPRLGFNSGFLINIDAVSPDLVSLTSNGTASNPSITWAADPNTGFWRPSSDALAASVGGTTYFLLIPGSLQGPGGTESLPGISFIDPFDDDTGIYRIAENQLGFSTGGTLALSVGSDQIVNAPIGLTVSGIPVDIAGEKAIVSDSSNLVVTSGVSTTTLSPSDTPTYTNITSTSGTFTDASISGDLEVGGAIIATQFSGFPEEDQLAYPMPGSGITASGLDLISKAPYSVSIDSLLGAHTARNSVMGSVFINDTEVEGLTHMAFSTADTDFTATGNNTIGVGDRLRLTTSGDTGCDVLQATLAYTRV